MVFFLNILPVLIGLVCIVLAFVPVRRSRVSHPCYTEGTIIGHRTQRMYRHHSGAELYAPVVRFTTPKGEITAASRTYLPEWQYGFRTGDKVKICYHAQQPDVFAICSESNAWRRSILLTAGIGTILAYGVLWLQYF